MKKRSSRSDFDEDDLEFLLGGGGHSFVVIERDPRPSEFTGVFSANGDPIYRRFVDKPPAGFVVDPEKAHLFDFDPEEDYYYTDDPGEIPEE